MEDMTNEYTIKILRLERSASDARELLHSMEKEVAASPTRLSEDKSRELDEARKNFSRLSNDALESKNTSSTLKSDMMVLKRLRKDESQLLKAIFSDPEWNGQEVVRAYYDEINNIRGSLGILQENVAYINTAKVYVEMAMRNVRACEEASELSEALRLFARSQEYLRNSVEAFAGMKEYIPESLLESVALSDRNALVSHVRALNDACQHAHKYATDAGHEVQEERARVEERLSSKENELLKVQRDLVVGSV